MAGRRPLPEGSKKSKSEVMKDYRKRNKAKVKQYEETRNMKRKLERLKISLDNCSKIKVKIGPRKVRKKQKSNNSKAAAAGDEIQVDVNKESEPEVTERVEHTQKTFPESDHEACSGSRNQATSSVEKDVSDTVIDEVEEPLANDNQNSLEEESPQTVERGRRLKARTSKSTSEHEQVLNDSDEDSDDLWSPRSRGQKRKQENNPGENAQKKSRQAEVGELIRKRNHEELKIKNKEQASEILLLRKALKEANEQSEKDRIQSEVSLSNARKVENKLESEKRKREFEDSWLKTVYFDLPPPERKKFKLTVFNNKENLPEGTLSRMRKSTGVNFNKPPAAENLTIPPVAEKIREFAMLNSSEKPDERSNASGSNQSGRPAERFAIHHVSVLHEQYQTDYREFQCSYSNFARWWPSYVVKPDLSSRTTCCCRPCENASLKLAALKKFDLIPKSTNIFLALKMERQGDTEMIDAINEDLTQLKDGPKKDLIVTYSKWEEVEIEMCEDERKMRIEKGIKNTKKKRPEKRPKSIKVSNLADKCKQEFEELKNHLHRNYVIKEAVGRQKDAVLNDVECKSAIIHVDWSEDIEMQPNREIQAGFFARKSFSLHSGFVYVNNKSFGFGALAKGSNHKAEAIHAAMKPVLNELLEWGITKFIFVSDSPVSQYRNGKAVYLLKEWVRANHVTAEWFFTEASHGKSPADGVGGGMKRTIREAFQFNSSLTINSLEDLGQLLKTQTGYRVDTFSPEDIELVKNTLPPRMTALKGALKIHFLTVDSNGSVKAKCLPCDPEFFTVKTDASFNPRPNNQNRLAPPSVTVDPEE